MFPYALSDIVERTFFEPTCKQGTVEIELLADFAIVKPEYPFPVVVVVVVLLSTSTRISERNSTHSRFIRRVTAVPICVRETSTRLR